MVLSFLIATLIMFALNLIFNIFMVGFGLSKGIISVVSLINVGISLIMLTWNIFAIATVL